MYPLKRDRFPTTVKMVSQAYLPRCEKCGRFATWVKWQIDPVDLHWGLQLASTLSRFVTCAIVFCGLRLGTYDSNTARPKTRIPLVAFYDPLLACS